MSRARAEAINQGICRTVTGRIVNEASIPLPEATLKELMTASHIVAAMNGKIGQDKNIPAVEFAFHTADRGIAAHYAEQHFGGIHGLITGLGYSLDDDDE